MCLYMANGTGSLPIVSCMHLLLKVEPIGLGLPNDLSWTTSSASIGRISSNQPTRAFVVFALTNCNILLEACIPHTNRHTHTHSFTDACTHTHTQTHTHTHTHAHMHTHTHTHTHTCTHAHTHTQTHTHVGTHNYCHTFTCVHTDRHTYMCTHNVCVVRLVLARLRPTLKVSTPKQHTGN